MPSAMIVLLLCAFAEADRHSRIADKLVEAMNQDDQAAIHKLFAPEMKRALPEEKSSEFFRGILRQRGKVTKVTKVSEQLPTVIFTLNCERGNLELQLTLDSKDLVSGLFIRPPKPTVTAPERNTIKLWLPFRDEWSVYWGGSTVEQNYHVNTPNQRRALDLVIRDKDDKSHSGNGARNEQYYCYGKEILAPAGGKVLTIIDGVPDNTPGSMNSYSAVGNCMIIQHADRIYSVLAHFQPGSFRVKAGDEVKPLDVLGKCGNSGNSSEPHLHYHLQHLPVLQDGLGITPFFENVKVTRDGKTTTEEDYTPIRGDRIRPM